VTLPTADSQISRGESLADTARVISRYADAIMFRTFGDARLVELAEAATVPVINGLSDGAHPVQLLADVLTLQERLGPLEGKIVCFAGDGASNMASSWAEAARLYGFHLRIAAPRGYQPSTAQLKAAGEWVKLLEDVEAAAEGADAIATDVWTSMGQETESARRKTDLRAFQVNASLLKRAKPQCVVLHCLPAHRGEEITSEVLDGPTSAVLDEAENRMHVQKALLEKLILAH
jgi:ornithine carbamoyltransferase